jgi:CheY-like chemotaxis protein
MQNNHISVNDKLEFSIQNESADSPGPRLLIVDDTVGIHEDFRKILRNEESSDFDHTQAALFGGAPVSPAPIEFRIDSAYQGKEACDLVERAIQAGQPYALAFLDVRMPPGWDGIETARRLWEVDPSLQIVICTAFSDYSWKDMAGRLGHTDNLVFLKKPFESIEILQLVHALTEKSKLSRQVRRRIEELDHLVAQQTQELRAANEELIADNAMRKAAEIRQAAFATLGKRLNEAKDAKAAAEIIIEVADELLGWDACKLPFVFTNPRPPYSSAQQRLHRWLSDRMRLSKYVLQTH